jgi:hypothetical protein
VKKAKPKNPSIGNLSFVAFRDGKTLPKATAKQCGRCFWHVKGTGDDSAKDDKLGQRLALEYLAFEEVDIGGGGNLQLIVSDMPRPLTMVEIAFLQMVSFAARAGAFEARRIAKYWDEMNARRKRRWRT